MLARAVRNGVVESFYDGGVVATDAEGTVIASWGVTAPTFFWRSAVKLVQATVSQEAGADMVPEQLAVACSSHSGWPTHLAMVRNMLTEVGLTEQHLQCPPAWPLSARARDMLVAVGHQGPRRIFHNCSGKHSGWLRACLARGWPLDTYLSPDHPLQQRVLALTREVSGVDPTPTGVDGCGAPVMRTTLTGAARTFAILSSDRRFAEATTANARYAALSSGSERPDARVGAWWDGPLKVGAAGLIAAGRNGIGIAAKSWSGDKDIAVVLLVEGARRLGLLSAAALAALEDVARPVTLGGGDPQGVCEPVFDGSERE
jgi:L-asparaginase II